MKFINRQMEIEFLKEAYDLSKRKLFSVVIYGLRRVGKTRLIEEFIKKKGLYFYVTKNKTSLSLLKDFEDNLRENDIISELERLSTWDDFFNVIFGRCKGIVAFDEFQNFLESDKSVFGILQKFIDLNEERKDLLLIFSGSTIGLAKKLFRDKKEPLYGRLKREIFLKPLSFSDTITMANELKITNKEEIVELYALFGGFPLYYTAIEDENLEGKTLLDILERFFLRKNAVFEEEVERILSLELGKRRGRYYDILTAIAQKNKTISEIASYLSIKETGLSRYINELVNYFEIISQEKQVIGSKKWFVINNPIINFWFRFFYKDLSLYKLRNKRFLEKINRECNSYIGKRFELICQEFLEKQPTFEFDEIGNQWGKFKGEKGKNTYEIDILALNKKTKEILFGECKWKDKVDVEKVVNRLKEKAGYVKWHNEKRKESYVIFAKSFKKKVKEKNVYLFDLEDMMGVLKK